MQSCSDTPESNEWFVIRPNVMAAEEGIQPSDSAVLE